MAQEPRTVEPFTVMDPETGNTIQIPAGVTRTEADELVRLQQQQFGQYGGGLRIDPSTDRPVGTFPSVEPPTFSEQSGAAPAIVREAQESIQALPQMLRNPPAVALEMLFPTQPRQAFNQALSEGDISRALAQVPSMTPGVGPMSRGVMDTVSSEWNRGTTVPESLANVLGRGAAMGMGGGLLKNFSPAPSEGWMWRALNRGRNPNRMLETSAGIAGQSSFAQGLEQVLRAIPTVGSIFENRDMLTNIQGLGEFYRVLEDVTAAPNTITRSAQVTGLTIQRAVHKTLQGALRPIIDGMRRRSGVAKWWMSLERADELLRMSKDELQNALKADGRSEAFIADALTAQNTFRQVEGALMGGAIMQIMKKSPEDVPRLIAGFDVRRLRALRTHPSIPRELFDEAAALGFRDLILGNMFRGTRPDTRALLEGADLSDIQRRAIGSPGGIDPNVRIEGPALLKNIQKPNPERMIELLGSKDRYDEMLQLAEELTDLQVPRSGRGTMGIALTASGATVAAGVGILTGRASMSDIVGVSAGLLGLRKLARLMVRQPGTISTTRRMIRSIQEGNTPRAIQTMQLLDTEILKLDIQDMIQFGVQFGAPFSEGDWGLNLGIGPPTIQSPQPTIGPAPPPQ